jgi:hypothetical protein
MVLYMFTRLPDSSHIVPIKSQDMATVSKMGPMIGVGLPKLRVLRQNPLAGSTPPRANRARDKVTQKMAISWCYPGPHRGDPSSSNIVFESRLGAFHHAPPPRVGWHLAAWVLPIMTTEERCVKPPRPDLHQRASTSI